MKKIVYIIASAALLLSCESRTYGEISDNPPITEIVRYNTDIRPIIESRCMGCHSPGGPGAFQPFTNYNQVRTHIDNIIDRIQRPNGDPLRMPPSGSLSQSQISLFTQWKADGLIEN